MGLQKLGSKPEAGFSRAAGADHTAVEITGVPRYLGPGVDGQKLRPGEDHIVFEHGIGKGLDVLFRAP